MPKLIFVDQLSITHAPIASSYGKKLIPGQNPDYVSTDYCHKTKSGVMNRIYRSTIAPFEFFIKRNSNDYVLQEKDAAAILQLMKADGRGTQNNKHKVLILEGGGAFGILPAYFASLVETHSLPWIEDVNCLSGASIGAVLALCYATGLSPSFVFECFQKRMPECFDKRFMAKINPLATPIYDVAGRDKVLADLLKESKLSSIKKNFPLLDIFIPSKNETDQKYKVFDNITGADDEELCRKVAGYSADAPHYYAGGDWNGKLMLDGGMIEVAPLITTVTGLFGKRKIPFWDMDVLMIGCGYRVDGKKYTAEQYKKLSLLGVATDVIVPNITNSNNMATLYWGQNLGLNSFTYFNPVTIKGDMADIKEMNDALVRALVFEDQFVEVWKEWIK